MSTPPTSDKAREADLSDRGFHIDRTICGYLQEGSRQFPDKVAVVAHRAHDGVARRITYGALERLVERAAHGLSRLGIRHGDVVAIQLPNCWQFVVAALACVRVGATVNPLVPILREREVRHMVAFAGSRLLIVPHLHRGFDHAAMAQVLLGEIDTLEAVIVVNDDDDDDFHRILLQPGQAVATDAPSAVRPLEPNDLLVLMYTSGTTGEPKGVMHTSNTVNGNLLAVARQLDLDSTDIFLTASPVGHLTGYATLMMLPLMLGATMVLQDVWDPVEAVKLIQAEGISFTAASTPFLADVCASASAESLRTLKTFYCAGAPISSALVLDASDRLGVTVCSAWGMSEVMIGTVTSLSAARRKSSTTDGRAVPGVELRIVDTGGVDLPPGTAGRLLIRSPWMFLGYLRRPELNGVDADGWLDSGDLARRDEEGYIRITGRTKELLIRGGENIPIVEIENLLSEHAAVMHCAIVGYPDERLGERACLFVVLKSGLAMDLADVQRFLHGRQVAKPYWPERLHVVSELPRTASGKVQRYLLKQLAAA